MERARRLAVFGSTGSVGRQALEVAEQLGLSVVGLIAGGNRELLQRQIDRYRPEWAVLATGEWSEPQRGCTQLASGAPAVNHFSREHQADLVVSAISGVAGLVPTWNAVQSGVDVALANKESLVAAGRLVLAAAEASGATLLPIDSEHSALWQCLGGANRHSVRRLLLTASGGAFRDWSSDALPAATAGDALAHPTWNMGNKVTVDSATLMNKGLEVIEAHWLFGVGYDQIEVVVHPQSIVHSLVEYVDGSILAQLAPPDLRLPIQVALTYPERVEAPWPKLDLLAVGQLTFQPPRRADFPCLDLAVAAGRQGKGYPIALNAANEVAVAAFLRGGIGFSGISRLVAAVLDRHQPIEPQSIDDVLEVDATARRAAESALADFAD